MKPYLQLNIMGGADLIDRATGNIITHDYYGRSENGSPKGNETNRGGTSEERSKDESDISRGESE